MTRPDYNALAKDIHQQNINAGWWKINDQGQTIPRNVGELLCLTHSEISECWYGQALHARDDHLPHHYMQHVEMADICIRVFDILGYYSDPPATFQPLEGLTEFPLPNRFSDFICISHFLISSAMEGFRKGNTLLGKMKLWALLDIIFDWAGPDGEGIDLLTIIEKKREYNRNRLDHKPENRAKDGGKKF